MTETGGGDALVTDGGTKTQFSSHSEMYEFSPGTYFSAHLSSHRIMAHTQRNYKQETVRANQSQETQMALIKIVFSKLYSCHVRVLMRAK